MKKVRILHVSTAHQPQDPRIIFKQCPTLAVQYEVFCALPNADPAQSTSIRFIRLPYFRRVIWRTLLTCPLIVIHCLWLRPKLIHFYVPEFIPFALLFQVFGTKVIYEVQENLYKKLHLKTINGGYFLKRTFHWFDRLAQRRFYLIFTEHGYLDTYSTLAKPHAVIYNYPLLSFLEPFRHTYTPNAAQPLFFYIGWLSFERAFDTILASLAQLKATYPQFNMHLFGQQTFAVADLEKLPAFRIVRQNLHFHGYADQRLAFRYAAGATAGLALLKPVGDYPESYTTKLFEYMALGLPVITSDFPLYRDVVERHNCGFCLCPYDTDGLTHALSYLIEHPNEARQMGERGREAIEKYYQWDTEAQKLRQFYTHILNKKAADS